LGWWIRQLLGLWTNNGWLIIEDLTFVRDLMLFGGHILELHGANNALVRPCVWGLDVSGSIGGGCGAGGVLWRRRGGGAAAGAGFLSF